MRTEDAATGNEGELRPTTTADRTTDTRDHTTNRPNDAVRELCPDTFAFPTDHAFLSGAKCRPTVQESNDSRRQAK